MARSLWIPIMVVPLIMSATTATAGVQPCSSGTAEGTLNPGAIRGQVDVGRNCDTSDAALPAAAAGQAVTYPYFFDRVSDLFIAEPCGTGRVKALRRYYQVDAPPVPGGAPQVLLLREIETCVTFPDPSLPAELVQTLSQADAESVITKALPQPVVNPDPAIKGLTGLETYLYYQDDGASVLTAVDHDGDPATPARPGLSITTSLAGFSITASAAIVQYDWDLGEATYTTTTGGTPERPAVTHLYNTKGAYTLTATTTWTGTYTWTSTAGTSGSGTFATITKPSAPRPYQVIEVRAVPVG